MLSLSSGSSGSLTVKIDELIKAIKNNDWRLSQGVFLRYLAMTSTFDSISKGKDSELILAKLLSLFEALAVKKTAKIISHVNGLSFGSEFPSFEYDSFETSSEKFMRAILKRVLVIIYSPFSAISKSMNADNKKQLEDLHKKVEESKLHYSRVLNKMTECTTQIFEATEAVTIKYTTDLQVYISNQVPDKEGKESGKVTKAKQKYYDFHSNLLEVACKNNKFLDYIHIYVAAVASDKELAISQATLNMCKRITIVLDAYTNYTKAEKIGPELQESSASISKHLSNDLIRFLTWSLSKISYGLMKNKKDSSDVYKKVRKHLRSDILSGGLETKYFSSFSEETKIKLFEMVDILQDPDLVHHLQKAEETKEDKYHHAIIHHGKINEVDRLIEVLHWNYERRAHPDHITELTQDELKLVRSVYAPAVKLGHITSNLIEITEFIGAISDGDKKQEFQELYDAVHTLPNFKLLYRMWVYALSIRVWYRAELKATNAELEKKAKERLEADKAKTDENEEEKQPEKQEDKKEEEETIDTTKGADAKSGEATKDIATDAKFIQDKQIAQNKLLKLHVEKAELLIKFTPPTQMNLQKDCLYGLAGPSKSKSIQSRVFKPNTDKDGKTKKPSGKVGTCEHIVTSLFPFFEASFTSKELLEKVEYMTLKGIKRYVGMKITQSVINCHSISASLVASLNVFCSALRRGVNRIARYDEKLESSGYYVKQKLQDAFFGVYTSMTSQLENSTDAKLTQFVLNCLKWDINVEDYPYLIKTNIFEVLKEGNGLFDRTKNIIKYSWGHELEYKDYETEYSLSHSVVDTFEFLISSILSKILKQSQEDENSESTLTVLKQSIDLVFSQLNRYCIFIQNYSPVDWEFFVKERNDLRGRGAQLNVNRDAPFDDELTSEELEKRQQDESKEAQDRESRRAEEAKQEGSAARDRVKELIGDYTGVELKKLGKLYSHQTILKLLRSIEVLTNLAKTSETLKAYVLKLTNSEVVAFLLRLMLVCQAKHAMVITKVLTNLVGLGIDMSVMDEATACIEANKVAAQIMATETVSQFEEARFLRFLFRFCCSATNTSSLTESRVTNTGHYNVVASVKQVFHSILRASDSPSKRSVQAEIDSFIANIDGYTMGEFDVITSLLEGGEYQGLGVGSHGITDDEQLITILGFVDRWYGLDPPNANNDGNNNFKLHNLSMEYKSKDHYILGLTYHKDNSSNDKIGIFDPAKISLIPNLEKESSDYLLDEGRLQTFLKAFKIDVAPNKADAASLSKRCVGMKILVNQIDTNGDKLSEILDPDFKNQIIELLLVECTNDSDENHGLKCEWLEQKLYAIKKIALEKKIPLESQKKITVSFKGRQMCLNKTLEVSPKEVYSQCVELLSAMNYGKIQPGSQYHVVADQDLNESSNSLDRIAILESDSLDTVQKVQSVFQHVDVIVTSDVDLKKLHTELKEVDENVAFFKTLILISKPNIDLLRDIINQDPAVKVASTDEMSYDDTIISEVTTFCNCSRDEVIETVKSLQKSLGKKEKEKSKVKIEESKEEQQAEDSKEPTTHHIVEIEPEDDPLQLYGLENNPFLDSKI